MKMQRKIVVGAACIIALGAVFAFERRAEAPAEKASLSTSASSPAKSTLLPAQTSAPAKAEAHRMAAEASADLFAAKSWYVAPPPPPTPKPVAPPFPFVFAGSMRDSDGVILFVAQGERNFIVRKGETIAAIYRLDDIAENEAVFTYLPLHEKQSLTIGTNQ